MTNFRFRIDYRDLSSARRAYVHYMYITIAGIAGITNHLVAEREFKFLFPQYKLVLVRY